jgi:hypothetical protein
MKSKRPHKKKVDHPRRVLRLPDLDHAKTVVLNTLLSLDSQRAYRFAMDDFIAWYCSEPSSTINLRLAAVRRLAYEAADTGLLSPELAAGIRRVKGAKRLGVRLGNWLTAKEAKALRAAQTSRPSGVSAVEPSWRSVSAVDCAGLSWRT